MNRPRSLIGETRTPLPAEPAEAAEPGKPGKPGKPERLDYEYKRNGTANLFVFLDAHRPWRHVKVTDRRAGSDFAECMRDLVDVHYPDAERIRVVLDNLSTHSAAMLYEAFPAEEARRILRRLELHFVPKHASWLNMVEIQVGVLKSQCLERRMATERRSYPRSPRGSEHATRKGARVRWMFTVEKARPKMGRAYPRPATASGTTERPLATAA